ncbi:ADP-ribosylation factor-like protein 2-binding protein [Atheta coriaria]|uniref:ADP-ribosylation factor-like protein 2-binding protein n=1 Tax=Dalotia coriaria TaxID=877792 RepID=UPI0031F3E30B
MDTEFLDMHGAFMEKHWHEFEDTEENKFSYTDIFNEYIETVEKYLENELTNRVQHFKMSEFEQELKTRQNDLEGEIFEILATFSDFCAFKTMFIDYKNMKEGKTIDFSSDLCVSKYITTPEVAEL